MATSPVFPNLTMTVLVPTYRRPKDLERCLQALQKQSRQADEVFLIVRDRDIETQAFLAQSSFPLLPLRTTIVTVPGVIAAINAGLDVATGNIISVTDDDAAPHPDWLEQIEHHFLADPQLGGVGGRDWVYHGTELEDGVSSVVGKVQWWGRMIGNHHIGTGQAREVDVLKGVNMSYRRSAIANLRCDARLKGTGAQVHFEVALSLAVKQQGWKLIYDPAIAVDHYPAKRFDEDQRTCFCAMAMANMAHNETVALLNYFSPLRRWIYLLWAISVGTRLTPGLVQFLRFLPREGNLAVQKYFAALHGRWQGWQTWRSVSQPSLDSFPDSRLG